MYFQGNFSPIVIHFPEITLKKYIPKTCLVLFIEGDFLLLSLCKMFENKDRAIEKSLISLFSSGLCAAVEGLVW